MPNHTHTLHRCTRFAARRSAGTRRGDADGAPPLGQLASQLSWLVASHVADNPLALLAAADAEGTGGRAVMEVGALMNLRVCVASIVRFSVVCSSCV